MAELSSRVGLGTSEAVISFENRGLFRFGRYRVDVGERHLLRDGEPVPSSLKGFDLLVPLVRRAGHLVCSKDDLLRQVWPGAWRKPIFVEGGKG